MTIRVSNQALNQNSDTKIESDLLSLIASREQTAEVNPNITGPEARDAAQQSANMQGVQVNEQLFNVVGKYFPGTMLPNVVV